METFKTCFSIFSINIILKWDLEKRIEPSLCNASLFSTQLTVLTHNPARNIFQLSKREREFPFLEFGTKPNHAWPTWHTHLPDLPIHLTYPLDLSTQTKPFGLVLTCTCTLHLIYLPNLPTWSTQMITWPIHLIKPTCHLVYNFVKVVSQYLKSFYSAFVSCMLERSKIRWCPC